GHKHADQPHPVWLLRARREWPRRRTTEHRNELASPHGQPPSRPVEQGETITGRPVLCVTANWTAPLPDWVKSRSYRITAFPTAFRSVADITHAGSLLQMISLMRYAATFPPTPSKGRRSSNLEIVACETLNVRAISAWISPLPSRSNASCR